MNWRVFAKNILSKISPAYRMANNTRMQIEEIKNMMINEFDAERDGLVSIQMNLKNIEDKMNEDYNSIWVKLENMEKILIPPPPIFHLKQSGFCPVCNQNTIFISKTTWLRDNFICSNCGSIPRQRALMLVIEKYYPNWKNLSIHESSPDVCAITNKFTAECKNYIVSQFYQHEELGIFINGYRNENLEKQTFCDEIFDIVITQDVVEHLYNPEKVFFEIARTLKHGGAHIFTVPIINKFNKTEIWAKKNDNGEPVFLKTAEWHGNPIDNRGSPVTMHWGFDIIDFIKKHSGLDTKIEYLYNLHYGIWAEYIEVFVSKKYNF